MGATGRGGGPGGAPGHPAHDGNQLGGGDRGGIHPGGLPQQARPPKHRGPGQGLLLLERVEDRAPPLPRGGLGLPGGGGREDCQGEALVRHRRGEKRGAIRRLNPQPHPDAGEAPRDPRPQEEEGGHRPPRPHPHRVPSGLHHQAPQLPLPAPRRRRGTRLGLDALRDEDGEGVRLDTGGGGGIPHHPGQQGYGPQHAPHHQRRIHQGRRVHHPALHRRHRHRPQRHHRGTQRHLHHPHGQGRPGLPGPQPLPRRQRPGHTQPGALGDGAGHRLRKQNPGHSLHPGGLRRPPGEDGPRSHPPRARNKGEDTQLPRRHNAPHRPGGGHSHSPRLRQLPAQHTPHTNRGWGRPPRGIQPQAPQLPGGPRPPRGGDLHDEQPRQTVPQDASPPRAHM